MWKGHVQFKKYISIMLSLCMLFTLFPMYTSAVDNKVEMSMDEIATPSNATESELDKDSDVYDEELSVSTPSSAEEDEGLEESLFDDKVEVATSSNATKVGINLVNQTLKYNNIIVYGLLPDGAYLDVDYIGRTAIDNEDGFDTTGYISAFDIKVIYNDDVYDFENNLTLYYSANDNYDFVDIYNLDDTYNYIFWLEADCEDNVISFDIYDNGIYLLIDPLESFRLNSVNILDEDYIYMDLNAGDVVINASTYSGYMFVDGVITEVSGSHSSSNEYYIYQSNDNNYDITGLVDGEFILPEYNDMECGDKSWVEYITDNTEINDVITNWILSANEVGRTYTPNNITVSGNLDCTIIIDNIWSSHQTVSEGRRDGGITQTNSTDTDLTVKLLGDNRLGNIYYCSSVDTNSLTITDFDGDEKSNNSLTLGNFVINSGNSHYNSLIGASDNTDNSVGIIINGGVIWGGTTTKDNCTVIGGGGNGKGVVTINGGTVTAVANSSGTAIGGGIGYSSYGGDAVVTITGGNVYAYNFGYYVSGEIIPACAIGGGSSRASTGNKSTTVTILGGNIYAYCVGGTAIGGGGSTTKNGGPATINITGGNITAISASNEETGVEAGCSIGGGTGGTGGNGGNVTLNISGNPILKTGSVGGGKTNNSSGYIGNATVNISGGEINAQIVMASGSKDDCSFNMTGGTIDNTNNIYTFIEDNGGAVYIEGGTAEITDGLITGCKAVNGGAIYISGGDFNMSGGSIEGNYASEYGGAVYVDGGNINISGGEINSNESEKSGGGIYVTSNENDFVVEVYSGSIINNIANENGGGIGIDVDSTSKVEVVIGSEPCLGLDSTHSHPIIENNTAYTQGGGLFVYGDESNISLNMYCGNVNNNFANYERSSDNISQTGGMFTWYGGEIGQGLCVTGGTLLDERVNSKDIEYTISYSPNYDGALESDKIAIITSDVIICLPAYAFVREGYYLVGWSEKSNPVDNSEIISIGANYEVLGNQTLYAIWSDVKPTVQYMVYIPDTIEIDDSRESNFDITVELSYFPYDATLSLLVNRNNILSLEDDNGIGLEYNLLDNEKVINSGDVVTTWSLRNRDSKHLNIVILDGLDYSGEYSDLLTFKLNYSEIIE